VQERPELVPGGTIDHVLQHEVKELGTHILVCDVAYSSPTADKLNFRKFFKFQVKISWTSEKMRRYFRQFNKVQNLHGRCRSEIFTFKI
jgi:hypothetical protein